MLKALGLCLLCVAAHPLAARAETFVIEPEKAGHEAVVKIPAAAVTKLSANSAQSLVGYADAQDETMRLSGDVLIDIVGRASPIEIKAENLVLELTPNSPVDATAATRADAARFKVLRTALGEIFMGHVVFDLQTSAGPMEIMADKVEHELTSEPGV